MPETSFEPWSLALSPLMVIWPPPVSPPVVDAPPVVFPFDSSEFEQAAPTSASANSRITHPGHLRMRFSSPFRGRWVLRMGPRGGFRLPQSPLGDRGACLYFGLVPSSAD